MRLSHNSGVLLPALLFCLSSLVLAGDQVVIAQKPDQPSPNTTERGIDAYRHGDSMKAIKILSEVVKRREDDADAWYYLALAFNREGELASARPALEQVVRLRPNLAEVHARLAFALILANESQKAITEGQRAIELGDQSPEAHYAIAEASLRASDNAKAIEEADLALKMNPGFASALVTKGMALFALKRYADASAALESFLSVSPNDPDAEVWRGQLVQWRANEPAASTPDSSSTSPQVFSGKQVTQRARILEKPEPSYTEEARKAGVEGTVVLKCVFAADGQVKHILITKALSYGLTTSAINAARRIKFIPALIDGRPVSMYFQLEYNFNLY